MIDYDLLATDYAAHRRVHPEVVRSLVSGVQLKPESRVLEIGCGTGNYARAIHQLAGCRCWGVDPSVEMLSHTSSESRSLEFQAGSAEQLPFEDHQFDLAFSVDVIHHVDDLVTACREAHRVLDSGGRLCTVTDSESIIRNRRPLASYFPQTVDVDLSRYPSIAELRRIMQQVGFRAIDQQMVQLPYQTEDIQIYRDKAFSCLHLIPDDAFQTGIAAMERDLQEGPIQCLSQYALLWGTKVSQQR